MPRNFIFDAYHSRIDWEVERTESIPYRSVLLPMIRASERVVTTLERDLPDPEGVALSGAPDIDSSLAVVDRDKLIEARDEETLAFCNTGNRRRGIACVHRGAASSDYAFFRYCAGWCSIGRSQIVKSKPHSPLWSFADDAASSPDVSVFMTFGLESFAVVAGHEAAMRIDGIASSAVRPFKKWFEVSDPSLYNIIGRYHLEPLLDASRTEGESEA